MPTNAVRSRLAHPLFPILWLAAVAVILFAPSLHAQLTTGGYDANAAWPLCGSLFLTSPDALDCPAARQGDAAHRDQTNDTFGPRLIGSNYDWHRGLDLDTDGVTNRIVYATTCGVVIEVDTSAGRPNYSVVLRHHRDETCSSGPPAATDDCGIDGCYYTRYKHLQNVFVEEGDTVERGEALGGSGANCAFDTSVTDVNQARTCDKVGSSRVCTCTPVAGETYAGTCPIDLDQNGDCPDDFNPVRYQCSAADSTQADCYEHVHFEVRDSYGQDSPGRGDSQRKAIHPLAALPYDNSGDADDIELEIIGSVTSSAPVVIEVTIENTEYSGGTTSTTPDADIDLQRVEVEVYENKTTFLQQIDQASASATETPDLEPYQVSPAYIDFVDRTRQYTYENTTTDCGPGNIDAEECLPYATFTGGIHESPFANDRCFPAAYDADYHVEGVQLDPADLANPAIPCNSVAVLDPGAGQFNGLLLEPANYNFSSQDYELTVTFNDLDNPSSLSKRCVKAFAVDARGEQTAKVSAGNCSLLSRPAKPSSVNVVPLLCFGLNLVTYPAVSTATSYEVWVSRTPSFSFATLDGTSTTTNYALEVNRLQYVWVKACNAAGCSSPTAGDEPATFTFGCL